MCLSSCWVTLSSSWSVNASVCQLLFCTSSIIIQLLPTKPVLFHTHITVFGLFYCEYQLPILHNFQFIQFTIKTKIMLPFIQLFHILLIVQEHVLLSPLYLGDISPFQHLLPILPFTGKSQTRNWSTTYSTYVPMEFLYSHRDFCAQQKHKVLALNIWSPGLGHRSNSQWSMAYFVRQFRWRAFLQDSRIPPLGEFSATNYMQVTKDLASGYKCWQNFFSWTSHMHTMAQSESCLLGTARAELLTPSI